MAGSVELAEATGLEGSEGLAPYLRFFESSWPGATDAQLHEALRDVPKALTPEDKLRYLARRLPWTESPVCQDVLLSIHRKSVEEGPFDCILGYSEGAIAAATFLVDSLKKCAAGDAIVPPKCAVFINGSTPFNPNGKEYLHADECGQLITIPTCHILAYNDPLVFSSVAMYHLCDEELASMLDHGRGHSIPQDQKSITSMTTAIRDLVGRTEGMLNGEEDRANQFSF